MQGPTPYDIVKQHFTLPFELYPYQVETANELAPLPRAGYYLDLGCVDSETEYLSPEGWRKISEYTEGKVGQFNLDGTVQFVDPLAYVKLPCPEMYRFKTRQGVDQMLSPEHRVLYVSGFGFRREMPAEEVAKRHWKVPQGWRGKFITTFKPMVETSLPLTDAELRLVVAVIADGHFQSGTPRCQVSIKKERNHARLTGLLLDTGLEYSVSFPQCEGKRGYGIFTFNSPLRSKKFDAQFYRASQHQLEVIADEVLHWDGSMREGRKSFSTTEKESADFVQYAFAAAGQRSTISYKLRQREGRKDSHEYTVIISSGSPLVCMSGTGRDIPGNVKKVPSTDGFKYCFNVPSTYLIFRRNGRIFASGNTGKTVTSTVSALFKKLRGAQHCLVLVPPILIALWTRWLKRIPGLKVTTYRGTPKERKEILLEGDFIVMSLPIFKLDYERITHEMEHRRCVVLVDEATSIKNITSQNHKKVRDFAAGHDLMLLTGTPLSSPADAYAYCKLVAPGVYRNLRQFENLHVAERDFFGNISAWRNLDLLAENMKVNSVRLLKEQILQQLPPITYTPVHYTLSPEHQRLYEKLADERLLELKDGGKLDATQATALYHALQQIVVNYDYFAEREGVRSASMDLVDQVLAEVGERKLIIFSNYRMTNRKLTEYLKPFHAAAAFGDITSVQQRVNIDRFIEDPRCKVLVAQPTSAGYGVDGLQDVCHDVLFLEVPVVPMYFHQASARVHRDGQKYPTHVRIGVAESTIQVRLYGRLLAKDSLVNKVQGSWQDLRDAIYGKE